jgi:sensor histidine kinase YesM
MCYWLVINSLSVYYLFVIDLLSLCYLVITVSLSSCCVTLLVLINMIRLNSEKLRTERKGIDNMREGLITRREIDNREGFNNREEDR